ncbi:MAG: histidine kinase [Bacteroidota bacterium]|nr:histidine kinase [Bacteroidota bacterium]
MKLNKRNPKVEIIIHLLAWCLLFGFPLIFMVESHHPRFDQYSGYLAYTMAFFIVFYGNYLYLIDKFLFDRNTLKFIAINVVIIAICAYLLYLFQSLGIPPEKQHHPGPPPILFVFRDITSMVFAVGLSVALRMTGKWYRTETERKEMEKDRFETELKNLKNQLNPHFLFNTLNNIYSLIPVHPEQAQETVHRLSHLLRYVLYENNDNFVPIGKEIDFLKSYIELMSLRLSDQVKLATEFNIESGNDRIAPMLFISLVENAFKHGISPINQSFVHINITSKEGQDVVCTVENSYFPKNMQDKSGSGIGQENLRKRLELLYPNHHNLCLENRGDTYFAQLQIKF